MPHFQLHPFQAKALETLSVSLQKQTHVLCVAPTGSGKSLIYEKAAKEPHRRTLLITPLVALARQQFRKLKEMGIPVTLGAGGGIEGVSLDPPPQKSGAWIISPETLQFAGKRNALSEWQPNLLVVDECHCLWEWGENFRPAFTLIPELLSKYSIPHSLWLTATLPHDARLQMRTLLPHPVTELGQFDLPARLILQAQRIPWRLRTQALTEWVRKIDEPGLIFVPTRESTQRIARLIAATGKRVISYHGGLSAEERKNIEQMVSQNTVDVIVTTTAFGMGMDYPHLNYVVLWQTPTSILSLVQAIGRVGRNPNRNSHALVLWDYDDFRLLEWTVKNSSKRKKEMEDLLEFLNSPGCRLAGLKFYFDRIRTSSPQTCLPCGRCNFCLNRVGKPLKSLALDLP